ncbi:MAG: kinase/pyrophosphorylase [Deltaproteobacteria bacterium]|nr:kinase/pyrophosphorylase [Deltaproteobacteria bacterium]
MSSPKAPRIVIVSDGTGRTCEQVIKAALLQFGRPPVQMVRKPNVRTATEARMAVDEAREDSSLIFYTLVSDETRTALKAAAEEHMIPAVDVLGPVLFAIATLLKASPQAIPNLLYELEKGHIKRIDAVDFTLEHDDGARLSELSEADVILVGVSRVSKSATCFVLACQGIRAANVPLILGLEPPRELLRANSKKIIGLTASVERLLSIRQARVKSLRGLPLNEYVDARRIANELKYATDLMIHYGWPMIDVSHKAVEEVAKEVLRVLRSS